MPSCPNCATPLRTIRQREGIFFLCGQCQGRAVTVPQIRRCAGDRFATRLLHTINTCGIVNDRGCPFCERRMLRFRTDGPDLELDACKLCNVVWFDPREFEAVPESVTETPDELALRGREVLAEHQVKQIAEQAREDDPSPDSEWKTIPAMFGLPVEIEDAALDHWPVVTLGLAAGIVILSVIAFGHLASAVHQFGFIPAQALRSLGTTLVTEFFVHAGWIHLLGNVYFLLVFGMHVEDYLGRARFALLILGATVTGNLLDWVMEPQSLTPGVGASGGIAGLLAFYALEFPRARLGFLWGGYRSFGYWNSARWIQLPAWGVFLVWVFMQVFGAFAQIHGFGGVDAIAHLGGAAAGLAGWLVWRKLSTRAE